MTDTTEQPTIEEPIEEKPGEAAKYRKRLRETEAERDALAQRLTGAQTSLVRQAAERTAGFDMTAFDAAGFTVEELFDDTGAFVQEQFDSQLDAIRAERPYVFNRGPAGPIIPTQGKEPPTPAKPVNAWEQAFSPQSP